MTMRFFTLLRSSVLQECSTFKALCATFFLCLFFVVKTNGQTNSFTVGSIIGTTGDYASSAKIADYDNDGDNDIAFYSDGANYRLYKNGGDGTFANTYTELIPITNTIIEPADLDGDGDIDIVAGNGRVYINNGSGTFAQLGTLLIQQNTGGGIAAIKIIDINNDGKKDIIWANYSNGTNAYNEVWLNTGSTGSATFAYSTAFASTQSGKSSLDVADIDADGDLDVVLGVSNGSVEVFKNGGGTFSLFFISGGYSNNVYLRDWDKDGDLDLITWSSYNGFGLRVYLNNGSGTFGSLYYASSVSGSTIDIGDLNGDGYIDAAISNGTGGTTSILINNGCGLVERAGVAVAAPHGVVLGDVSGDGKPDIFIMSRYNTSTNQSRVYINDLSLVSVKTAPGNALNFDGTNDYVSIPDANSLDLTSSYTIEAWIKPTSFSAAAGIVSKYHTVGSNGYLLRLAGTAPYTGINFDGLETATGILQADRWYHIAAVKSGSTRTLYINGVSVAMPNGSAITTTANTDALTIGVDYLASPRYFNGSIDEVRIWNTARTPSEITTNNKISITACSNANLVAYYKFDNGTASGNNGYYYAANDLSTNNNNGILTNFSLATGATSNWVESYAMVVPTVTAATNISATGFTANWAAPTSGTVTNYLLDVSTSSSFSSFVSGYNGLSVSGTSQAVTGLSAATSYYYRVRADKTSVTGQGAYSSTITAATLMQPPGNAINFDGSNDIISGNNTNLPQGNSARTIETWVKNSAGNDMTIFNYGDPAGGNNQLFALHLYNGVYIIGQYNDIATNYNINDGKWHHLAVTHDGTTTKIYVDGNLINSTAKTYNTTGTSFQIASMNRSGYRFFFNGTLDEMRVWNTARTQADIQANMYNTISASASGLVAYYNFDNGTASGTNTGLTTLTDQSSSAANGTLTNFALTGTTSNWVESYAMVVPTATAATNIGRTGFTANWAAPSNGTVTNYFLDVSTSSSFSSFVSGYNGLSVSGTSQAVTGLTSATTYYYRVRADKTSVTGQGAYSNSVTIVTNADPIPTVSAFTPTSGCPGSTVTITGTNFGTPAPFSASDANLKLWIDATTFTTSNGGSLAGIITDASGSNRALTTTATFETNAMNGKPVVRYNNNASTRLNTPFISTSNTYIFMSVELVAFGTNWGSIFSHSPHDNGLQLENNALKGNNFYHWQTANDNSNVDQTITYGTQYVMAVKLENGNQRSFTLYKNDGSGNLQNLGTVSSSCCSFQAGSSYISIGNNGNNSEWVNMRMGEFIYFQNALPTTETSIVNYLADKWLGTSINVSGPATTGVTIGGTPVTSFTVNSSTQITAVIGSGSTGTVSITNSYGTGTSAGTFTVNDCTNANLSALSLSSGILSPTFAMGTTSYTMSVTNATTSITVTPTVYVAGATVKVNNVSTTSGSPSASINLNTGLNTITVQVTALDGITTKTYTINVTRALNTWLGGTSTDFNNPLNWSGGAVPTVVDDFVVATSVNNPIITGTHSVNNFTINSGASLTVTGTLKIAGSITNNGSITATSGTVELNGSTAQAIPANTFTSNTVENLIINNSAGVSLDGTVIVTGVLTPTAGVLNTGGNLTLASTATGTASIAAGSGTYITGNVTAQRYTRAQRGYRTFGHPFSTAQNLGILTDNFRITGLTTNAGNGTYATSAGNPSAFLYDPTQVAGSTSVLTRLTDATANIWERGNGLYVFVRGAGNEGMNGTGAANYSGGHSPLTLDGTGAINQGDVTVNLGYALGMDNYNLIGNPYPCPINLKAVTGMSSFGTVYVYNPTKNVSGADQYTLAGGFDQYTNNGSNNIIVPAFGAFYIQATSNGQSLTFKESDKAVGGTPDFTMFGTSGQPKLRLAVANTKGTIDEMTLGISSGSSDASTDKYDAAKLGNSLFNFYSIASDRKALAIDYRANLISTIPLGIQTSLTNTYSISLSELIDLPNTQVVLRDKLLKTETILSQVGDSYSFTITADTATKGENRFEIGLLGTTVLPVQIADITAQLQTNKTVAVNWTSTTEVNLASYKVQRSKDGSNFTSVGTVAAKGASAYNYTDDLSTAGVLPSTIYYRLEALDKDGSKTYSKVVSCQLPVAVNSISIYPNPVQATLFAQVTVTKAGAAQLKVVDAQGKVVATQKTQLAVGTTSISIPAAQLSAGSYVLEIETTDGKQTQRFVKE